MYAPPDSPTTTTHMAKYMNAFAQRFLASMERSARLARPARPSVCARLSCVR
jgi:hypothetical protein